MTELWAFLGPILVSDALNPVLLGILIYALGARRPYLTSLSLVAGHTVTYFVCGIGLAVGYDKLSDRLANPKPYDFAIEVVIGIAFVWLAWYSTRPEQKEARKETGPRDPGPVKAFVTGAVVNLIGIPFAVPYFAALNQIVKSDLDWLGAILVLAVYNLGYALPFLGLIGLRLVLGKRAEPILDKINHWIDRGAGVLMPLIFLVLGIVLIVDAVKYFVTGVPLF
jgi:cytochrome c biogenesis protein CcdA